MTAQEARAMATETANDPDKRALLQRFAAIDLQEIQEKIKGRCERGACDLLTPALPLWQLPRFAREWVLERLRTDGYAVKLGMDHLIVRWDDENERGQLGG